MNLKEDEKILKILKEFKISIEQFYICKWIMNQRYDLVVEYDRSIKTLNANDLEALINKGLLVDFNSKHETENRRKRVIGLYSVTEKFKGIFYGETDELFTELWKNYPKFIRSGANTYPAITGDLDELGKLYGHSIDYDIDAHKEVLELLKWAKENNLIKTGLEKFVKTEAWKGFKELMDKGNQYGEDI